MKWLLLFAILIVSNSCKKYKPPKSELCGYSRQAQALKCNDERRPKGSRDYTRPIINGDICTKPESFERTKKYVIDIRAKLIQTENKLRNCEKKKR